MKRAIPTVARAQGSTALLGLPRRPSASRPAGGPRTALAVLCGQEQPT